MATAGARAGLGVGAITCLLVAGLGLVAVRRGMEHPKHEEQLRVSPATVEA